VRATPARSGLRALPTLCASASQPLNVAAPVRARKTRFKPIGWASASGSGAQWTARLTDSLRLWCEGLEEKFLERGAPAPLSVRLEGRLSPRPESGTRRAVAALVTARSTGFKPNDRVRTSNSGAQWTARPTLTLRLSVSAVKRSRACKGAENKIQTQKSRVCVPGSGAQWTGRPTLLSTPLV